MSKSKQQGRQGKKKKAAAPKVAAHAPAIASKKAKAVVLTKKQLIQHEKAARKRNNNNNNNNSNTKKKREDLTSLFGPINSNTMAAEKRANYKNHIQSKKGSSNSSNSGASKNGSSSNNNNNNNNKSNRNNNNYHDNKHRTVSIDLDGVPLHHKHSYSRDQSSSKNNNYKGKNQKKRAPPPTAPPAAAATFELQSVQNSKNCKVPWWRHEHVQAWKQSSKTKESSLQGGVPGVPSCSPKRNQQNASNNKSHYLFRDTTCPTPSTSTTTTTTGEWLSQLTAELESFAHYVQVNDTECAARNFMVSNIQHLSRHSLQLQQIDGGDRDQIRVHVFGSYATKPVCAFCSDVDMALFGVVPVPEGDDDENDHLTATATATARGQHIRFGDNPPQEEPPNKSTKKKETLVQKWRDAFAEFDQSFAEEETEEAETTTAIPIAATKAAVAVAVATNMTVGAATAGCWQSALDQLLEGSNEGPDAVTKPRAYSDVSQQTVATETTATSDVTATTSNIHIPNRDINKKSDDNNRKEDDDNDDEVQVIMQVVDLTNNASDEERAATPAKSMNAANSDDTTSQVFADAEGDMHMPTEFFIVDRVGLQDKNDKIKDERETSSNDEVVVVAVKQAPQQQEGKEKRVPTGSRKRPLPPTKEEDSACGSDSEDDTSDKLDSLLARKQQSKQTRPSSSNSQITERSKQNQEQAVVSLSSSDDDNDEKGDEKKDDDDEEEEWNDLQVSFVSKPAGINKKAVVGPQGLVRVKVVNALNNLGNILQRRQYTENVRVIRKARVPIVKFQTKLGFEGDVAVGGHTGTDTSQFAMSQVARFKSFAPVVMALKILLWQHNLDAPFTGGLGSYKLYVLVAHHLERHMEMGGEDCPGEVFISFLIRFGKVKRGLGIAGSGRFSEIDGRCSTSLNTQTILQTQDGYEADMSAVFLVQHCVELFRRCWSKLAQRHISSTTNISKSNNNSSNGNTTPRSILVDLYDLEKLKEDRIRSLEKASLLERYDKSSKSNKSSNAGGNNGRIYENSAKRRKMQ